MPSRTSSNRRVHGAPREQEVEVTVQPYAAEAPVGPRRWAMLALKLAVTFGAITFLLVRQPLSELSRALGQISLFALALGVGLQGVALCVGTFRWQVLMQAYGASTVPAFTQLLKAYFVGYFYNTYVPGAVGGDLLRGVITRKAFATQGTTGAVAVVLVERGLGLAGVMGLTAISTVLFARGRFGNVLPYSVFGLVAVLGIVLSLAFSARLARLSPPPIARIMSRVPALVRPWPFALACGLSLVTHSIVALCGHVLIHAIESHVSLGDSFLVMPLAGAAGYFPFTLAGVGPRDTALVKLYEAVGASGAAGTATAFAYLFASLLTAALGGLVQLLSPLALPDLTGARALTNEPAAADQVTPDP